MKDKVCNTKKWDAILFTGIILVFIFGNLFYYATKWETITESISSSWNKESTFAENIDAVTFKIESTLQKNIYNRQNIINLNGLFLHVIGKDIVEDVDSTYTVYNMTNGQLTFSYDEIDVSYAIESMCELQKICDQRGIQLLYFQVPYKVNAYENTLPSGYIDGTNRSADMFLDGLSENNISFIDYRSVLNEDTVEYSSVFFDGDHHWTEESGFGAYLYLMNYMSDRYGISMNEERLDSENFSFTIYPDSYIGSQLSRVGFWYADVVDDFTVISPKFNVETSYIYDVYDGTGELKKTRDGTFTEAVMVMSAVKNMDVAKEGRDSVYLGHNPAVDIITNNNSINKDEILILEDSFSRPISAFTSLQFSKTHVMDLRQYHLSLIEYLESHEGIKYVVISYAATNFKESTYKTEFTFTE